MSDNTILIIGANSAIADAIAQLHLGQGDEVYAVSRYPDKQARPAHPNLHWMITDHTESNINALITHIAPSQPLTRIYICLGVLHHHPIAPEKKIEDINLEQINQIFHVNTFLPILWLKSLKPLLRKSKGCTITCFSARVGSIEDNKRGGWYSYRSSKAALNMLLKSASLEFAFLNKHIKILAFHPGTVDSFLSKPFQKMLAKGQLLQANDVAQRLDGIINNLVYDGQLSYLDWKGKEIPF